MDNRLSTADLVDDRVEAKIPPKTCVLLSLVIGVLALATVVLLIVTIVLVTNNNPPVVLVTNNNTQNLCLTEDCVKSAASYINALDKTVDPCDNFYEYACGGWIKSHTVPVDGSSYSQFSVLIDDLYTKLRVLIERDPQTGEPTSYEEARNYYKSCVDIASINSLGIKPLTDLLDAVGGWPVLGNNPGGNWSSLNFDFELMWSTLKGQYGVDGAISVNIQLNDRDSIHKIIKIDQSAFEVPGYKTKDTKQGIPVLTLVSEEEFPDDYGQRMLLSEDLSEVRQAYLQYMIDIAVVLGGNEAVAAEEMTKVLEFEIEVEKFKVPDDDRKDPEVLYNPTTIGELGTLHPTINWIRFFELLFPASVKPPVTVSETVINVAPAYLKNVTIWLTNQDTRIITNYMVWKLVGTMVPYLGDTFHDIELKFLSSMKNATLDTPRWKNCVVLTNAHFAYLTGKMYVDEHFSGTTKEMASTMVDDLQKTFKSIIKDNDWLQDEDKTKAMEKIDKITVLIGYPDFLENNAIVDFAFGNMSIAQNTFFQNNVKLIKSDAQSPLQYYRNTIAKDTWITGPATVNAFYVPPLNSIQIPAAILQPPLFNTNNPQYYNFGGIGTILGHELTHGFDNTGRRYDKDGNLRAWWTQPSINTFNERSKCLVDQYSDFVVPENGKNVNGNLTLGENIADVGGLKEAYKTYKDDITSQPLLPGLDFTEEQMFFLTSSQVWCSVSGEEWADLILKDVHSPGRYRVIGGLQNNEDFSKAFNCPKGSYMNPDKKCNVW